MRVLYASTLYPPSVGGAQIHLHQLARAVQGLGHDVRVLTHAWRTRRDWLRLSTVCARREAHRRHDGVDTSRIGFSARARLAMLPWVLLYYPSLTATSRRIAAEMAPDLERMAGAPSVVHVTRIGREFLAGALLDLARRRGIPFVLTPNHHPRWRGPLYREYDRIYREADAVIALTAAEKRALVEEKGVRAERVHVTGIGPLLAEAHSAHRFREEHRLAGRFVLFLGQQLEYKGLGALLAAAPRVWRRHPDVRFVFVGPPTGYSARLFAQARDPRVVNLGEVDLATKTSALAACELLCVPSVQESFGGVYVEAWSLGKTVIGGRIPPIACVVDEGRDGLLSTQNPPELAAALDRLLSDPALCASWGAAGRAKVERQYTWERIAERTMAVYRGVAASAC